ncbi:hypothetical protein [Flavobacterium poyangense]|uniref:hypothetical protein n=1 Tax=Flavobacterium poyangense TaxID=2204302 RepID=UPI001420394D|nr:hypothetical protein [Flavobacterium sp. JXAS1]
MFNSPVLDTAIGLVFIFLLYSLLATSVNEAISTLFGLRARMLKKGIVDSMLSDTERKTWLWFETAKGIWETILEPFKLIAGYKPISQEKLGDKFYDHPVIKNYGYNNRSSIPSYISKENFSTILIEVLKKYWDKHKEAVTAHAKGKQVNLQLEDAPDITKIYYLVDYLLNEKDETVKKKFKDEHIDIDKETLEILQLHLKKSYLNLDAFTKQIEDWYDDTMNRIAGWYKKQVQFWLFGIGLVIAISFNVDIIEIAGTISTDKDARDKLVEMAIKEADALEGDPRVAQLQNQLKQPADTADTSLSKEKKDAIVQGQKEVKDSLALLTSQLDSVKKQLNGRIKDANNLLAIGWGDYGLKRDSAVVSTTYKCELAAIRKELKSDVTLQIPKDSTKFYTQQSLKQLYDKHPIKLKAKYVLEQSFDGRKFLGFLLLAFGICLGAPFWFDLLQKFIKIRGAGKKETTENAPTTPTPETQPVQVTVNSNTNTEAVG